MIHVERDQLAAAVAFAQRGLAKTAVHPALSGIRLSSKGKRLTVSAFDYDVHATAEAVATGPDLDLLLPGALLARYVAGMPEGTVEVHEDGTLNVGAARVVLHPLASQEYPATPDRPATVGQVDAETLWAAFDSVRECVDVKAPKKDMTGVCLTASDTLNLAGLNNFRMAARSIAWEGSTELRVVVPLPVLDAAKSMIGTVTIGLSEQMISIADSHRNVTGRLIAFPPPNFERLFEVNTTTNVTVDRAALAEAMKFVVLGDTRKDVAGRLTLDVGTETVRVAICGMETLDASTEIDAKVEGDPLQVTVKAGYLLNGLNATDAQEVRLGFSAPSKAFSLAAIEDPSLRFVCMPVRS